jgi:serine/threonine-protein kinase
MLPGGRAVLFTIRAGLSWDDAQIVMQSLATGARTVVVRAGRDARYVQTGHLLYARRGSIFAVPFDARRLEAIGSEVPVLDGVRQSNDTNSGAAQFSIARDGTLVYVPSVTEERRLVWVDRQGRETVVPTPPRLFQSLRISPDGARVAVNALDQDRDVWIWDFSRQTLDKLTSGPAYDSDPVWTPDGRRLIFASEREGPPRVFWQSADGSGAAERLSDTNGLHPSSITPDGSRVVLRTGGAPTDVTVLPVSQGRRVERLVHSPYTERNAEVSPDGRWIAYESDESGEMQVYVRSFPDVNEGRWQVSTGGGVGPMWARSGRELFYHPPGGGLMAVSVIPKSGFAWAAPSEVVKDANYLWGFNERTYDIGLDDLRFLMVKRHVSSSGTASVRINVVENWFEELKRLVPSPR